jgi:hypothetical protein
MKRRFEMTERRALALVMFGTPLAMVAVISVLRSMRAGEDLQVLVFILALAVAAHLTSRVVVHYSEKKSSEDRR